MDNKKFEILLEEDRNWLSKYGGFISLIIIIFLISGVFIIKIPEYNYLSFTKEKNIPYLKIKRNNFSINVGDSLKLSNQKFADKFLIVDSVKIERKYKIIFLKNGKNSNKESSRLIVNENTLLQSLLNPFLVEK